MINIQHIIDDAKYFEVIVFINGSVNITNLHKPNAIGELVG